MGVATRNIIKRNQRRHEYEERNDCFLCVTTGLCVSFCLWISIPFYFVLLLCLQVDAVQTSHWLDESKNRENKVATHFVFVFVFLTNYVVGDDFFFKQQKNKIY